MSRFDRMREQIQGDSWLDGVARMSVEAARRRFEKTPPRSRLTVDVDAELDAHMLATISGAVQDAVARVGHYLADSNTSADRVTSYDRDRARLFVRPGGRNQVEFVFTDPTGAGQLFPLPPGHATPAERAVAELIDMLPSAPDDHLAVDAALARARASRNAIRDIATAVLKTTSVAMRLTTGDRAIFASTVTSPQAKTLRDELQEEAEVDRQVIDVVGRVDGMRTRRRIFYLETARQTYEGGFDSELVPIVASMIDKPALARIERVRTLRQSGPPGRWSNRLISLADPPKDGVDPRDNTAPLFDV